MIMMYKIKQYLKYVKIFLSLKLKHACRFPLINTYNGTAYVIVNGPSMKQTFKDYDDGKLTFDNNVFMVSLSALDPHFLKIKPKHYCLSDPMYRQDYPPRKNQIKEMYRIMNEEVDWDMNLYVFDNSEELLDEYEKYANISNPHIKIIKVMKRYCSDLLPSLRHRLYGAGYYMPEDGTVANVAIYLALAEGYKEIKLYGADHNFFLDFAVNDNNQLCSWDRHYYDNGKPKLKVFEDTRYTDGRAFRVHYFMLVMYNMFRSHDLLQEFSQYLGSHITNCTPGSMIDSYDREKLG